MYLKRLLSINVATFAALGTLLLGMGQRNAWLPLLMMFAAIMSVAVTDLWEWFKLNRAAANVAALAAVAISLSNLTSHSGDARVLAISNLLIYLQIIFLFLEKDERIYRLLIVLSLLQAVIATAFSQGVSFGVLLIFYMLVGLSALALLCLFWQWNRQRAAVGGSPRPAVEGSRWPLAAEPSVFTSVPGGTGQAGIGRELFGRLVVMGLWTLVVTVVVFFTLPRLGRSAWQGVAVSPKQVVGFDDTVQLGAMGDIIESPEEVMKVYLTDTDEPYPLRGVVYLRGAILTHYENNQWSHPVRRTLLPSRVDVPGRSVVKQRIEIEPIQGRNELFCIWPSFAVRSTSDAVRYDPDSGRFIRDGDVRGRRFSYELGTTALDEGTQALLNPARTSVAEESFLQEPDLPHLEELARSWLAESGVSHNDRMGRARWLEHKLRDSGQFQYSLEGQPRDPNIDNIEDFVTNCPRGHCEYFATALAMMLRAEGIPSRVVVGYLCDEYVDFDRPYFQVRQWHAHAWVEAYIDVESLPEELRGAMSSDAWRYGGWLRLDATPGTSADGPTGGTSRGGQVSRGLNWVQSLWDNYVVDMDRQRQRRMIYEPIAKTVRDVTRRLGDPQWWRDRWAGIRQALRFSRWTGWWWLVLGLVALLVVPLVVFVAWKLARLLRRWWARLAGRPASGAANGEIEVEFYRRLETELARHGLARRAGETQHEFAAAAGAHLAETTGQEQLASLPVQVVDAYYRVRFGRLPLDSSRAETVEHALAELSHV